MAQVWLVTGSSRGLGRAIVEAGLAAGNKVLATARDTESLRDLTERYGDRVKLFALDVVIKAVVTVRLGPKAGVLVGTVSDANTGALVSPCIEFRKPSDAANYLLIGSVPFGGAQFRFLLPSNTDVTMEVRELNHKRWFYPGTLKKSESTSFRLTPGQELKLDIRM